MKSLETFAREDGRTLLLLDTKTGSLAEMLYTKWGWQTFGIVDGYTIMTDGNSDGTIFMLKRLDWYALPSDRHWAGHCAYLSRRVDGMTGSKFRYESVPVTTRTD